MDYIEKDIKKMEIAIIVVYHIIVAIRRNIIQNLENYPDHNILGISEPNNEDEIKDLLKLYLEKMKQSDFYAGDKELAITSHYLNININVFIKDSYSYKF